MQPEQAIYISVPTFLTDPRVFEPLIKKAFDERYLPMVSVTAVAPLESMSVGDRRAANEMYVIAADEIWFVGSSDIDKQGQKTVGGVPMVEYMQTELVKADELGTPVKIFDVTIADADWEIDLVNSFEPDETVSPKTAADQ